MNFKTKSLLDCMNTTRFKKCGAIREQFGKKMGFTEDRGSLDYRIDTTSFNSLMRVLERGNMIESNRADTIEHGRVIEKETPNEHIENYSWKLVEEK